MNQPVKVKFQECTKSEYEAMSQHFNNIVYSCYDTGELFKGDIAFGGGDTPGPGPEPGNNDFVVTYTEDEHEVMHADKTFAEISAAITAGKNVKAKWVAFGEGFFEFSDIAQYQNAQHTEVKYLNFVKLDTQFSDGNTLPNSMDNVQVWFINHDENENITGYYETIWQHNS